jgi:HSF-type DNA-binding
VHTGTVQKGLPPSIPIIAIQKPKPVYRQNSGGPRLNKFVRRLHDMIQAEKDSGVVEWRRGLLVLFSTDIFAKKLLPKYFATKNFKTCTYLLLVAARQHPDIHSIYSQCRFPRPRAVRRQLNYYGFVHVRSFNTTGASPTALWVNRSLAQEDSDNISSVLKLKRVEPCETARTAEGRRQRKELAKHTVEQDIGVSARTLQMDQIRCLTKRDNSDGSYMEEQVQPSVVDHFDSPIPREVQFMTDTSKDVNGSFPMCFSRKEDEGAPSPVLLSLGDIESESAANVLLMLSRAH